MKLSKQNALILLDELKKTELELERFSKVWDEMADNTNTLEQSWQAPIHTAIVAKIEIIKGALSENNAFFFSHEAESIND